MVNSFRASPAGLTSLGKSGQSGQIGQFLKVDTAVSTGNAPNTHAAVYHASSFTDTWDPLAESLQSELRAALGSGAGMPTVSGSCSGRKAIPT